MMHNAYKSELVVTPLNDGKTWVLVQDFTFYLPGYGLKTIKEGFAFDFASIPRIFYSFIGSPATGKFRYAALIHDWLYLKSFTTRKEADDIFLKLMKQDGVSWLKRNAMYQAVRLGGWVAWNKQHKKD